MIPTLRKETDSECVPLHYDDSWARQLIVDWLLRLPYDTEARYGNTTLYRRPNDLLGRFEIAGRTPTESPDFAAIVLEDIGFDSLTVSECIDLAKHTGPNRGSAMLRDQLIRSLESEAADRIHARVAENDMNRNNMIRQMQEV